LPAHHTPVTAISRFLADGARLRGLRRAPSQFGTHPPALWARSREIAHIHGRHVEIRLTRKLMARLRPEFAGDARVDYRRPGSDWVRVQLRGTADLRLALRLLRIAIRANREREMR
jgi:hypothetical protein